MTILQVLIDPILPVFAIMILGYLMGRTGATTVEGARIVNRIAMTVLLPILVFGLMAQAPMHEFSLASITLYGIVEAVVFSAGYWLARQVFKREAGEALLLGFCGTFANNAFFNLPIALLLYGEKNVLPITSIISFDATIAFGGALIALQLIKIGRASVSGVVGTIIKTPVLIAIIAGIVFALLRLPIPAPVKTFIDFNGSAAAPVALFALGVVLSQTPFRTDPTVLTFSFIKLAIFPAAIWFALRYGTPSNDVRDMFVFASAGPTGTMAFSLALLYNIRTEAITQIIIWTCLLSLFLLAALA